MKVGDVQDVVEVAMGGKPLTMTVEGRERYPVRVRYARTYRDDVDALKRILVSAAAPMPTAADGMGGGPESPRASAPFRSRWRRWPTSRWWKGRR